ncbi:hypothetical protein [Thalassobacillus sp. CUG 92003]|uniref:hypothetical protein n=1 Tax=Thalassobacillus sp. CUG 92003 TaxID=2736641 RepID=UPI0015E6B6D6|nr:hypothetical protein [Thalassobacillus sp. CUG 92003]
MFTNKRILIGITVVFVLAFATYTYGLKKQSNIYHEYIETYVVEHAFFTFIRDWSQYNHVIDQALEKQQISQEDLKMLHATYSETLNDFIQLSDLANTVINGNTTMNLALQHLSDIMLTFESLEKELDGADSMNLDQKQVEFLKSVKTFNTALININDEHSDVSEEELLDFDESYWIDYLQKLNNKTRKLRIMKAL